MVAGLYSCSKEAGATGATGATGTANVMHSGWTTLRMSYNSTDSAYEQTLAADSITQAVLDSGVVIGYIEYTNSASQTQVENASSYMEEVFGVGSVHLYSAYYDLTGANYRYIIIPGGGAMVAGRSANAANTIQGYTKAQWQAMTYEQVMALLKKQ